MPDEPLEHTKARQKVLTMFAMCPNESCRDVLPSRPIGEAERAGLIFRTSCETDSLIDAYFLLTAAGELQLAEWEKEHGVVVIPEFEADIPGL